MDAMPRALSSVSSAELFENPKDVKSGVTHYVSQALQTKWEICRVMAQHLSGLAWSSHLNVWAGGAGQHRDPI